MGAPPPKRLLWIAIGHRRRHAACVTYYIVPCALRHLKLNATLTFSTLECAPTAQAEGRLAVSKLSSEYGVVSAEKILSSRCILVYSAPRKVGRVRACLAAGGRVLPLTQRLEYIEILNNILKCANILSLLKKIFIIKLTIYAMYEIYVFFL